MKQLILSDKAFGRLQQALTEYDLFESEQSSDIPWSVEDHADLQQICDEIISVIRPHLVAASDEAI